MRSLNVTILGYFDARGFLPTEPTVAIRAFDLMDDRPCANSDQPLAASPSWVGEIKAVFEDLDPIRYRKEGALDIEAQLLRHPFVFTQELADRYKREFEAKVVQNPAVKALMVHCTAGVNRSPALARSLCEAFGISPVWVGSRTSLMNSGWIGNAYVYSLITGKEIID